MKEFFKKMKTKFQDTKTDTEETCERLQIQKKQSPIDKQLSVKSKPE